MEGHGGKGDVEWEMGRETDGRWGYGEDGKGGSVEKWGWGCDDTMDTDGHDLMTFVLLFLFLFIPKTQRSMCGVSCSSGCLSLTPSLGAI